MTSSEQRPGGEALIERHVVGEAADFERLRLDGEQAREALRARGIEVRGPGAGVEATAELFLHRDANVTGRIDLHDGQDNVVVIGPASIRLKLLLRGSGNRLVMNRSRHRANLVVTMRCHGGTCILGEDFSANQADLLLDGKAVSIVVGRDVMCSYGVQLRTHDSHGIFSIDDPTHALNPPADVRVGDHVWLAQGVLVMPGGEVGDGAIVGARSVVTSRLAAETLSVGVPARPIRERVSWTRQAHPEERHMRAVIRQLRPAG